jgi:arylsulfatase
MASAMSSSGCRAPADRRPDLLLIIVDTLRADRLGTYGYDAPTSPTLDALAVSSVVYERATATAPFTMPSVAALMTGRYGDHVGVRNHSAKDRLTASAITLAEVASAAGYRTSAVVSNPWLARRDSGFAQGFDEFATRSTIAPQHTRLTANIVVDHALEMLDHDDDRPLLQWVHFMDTHMPYAPPAEFAGLFGNPSARSRVIDDFNTDGFDRQSIYFDSRYSDEELAATRGLYDAAIRFVDSEIAGLLAGWDERRARERVTIVVSDHGESLGDHGLFFAHDFTLYDELLRVPLIVRDTRIGHGRVEANVSLIDVLPFLCRQLSLKCPQDLDGIALPTRERDADAQRMVFAAGPPKRRRYGNDPWITVAGMEGRWTMAKRGRTKLLHTPRPEGDAWQAFDLGRDPREVDSIYDTRLHAGLRDGLMKWRADMLSDGGSETGDSASIDDRTREELRALGYLD